MSEHLVTEHLVTELLVTELLEVDRLEIQILVDNSTDILSTTYSRAAPKEA